MGFKRRAHIQVKLRKQSGRLQGLRWWEMEEARMIPRFLVE